MTGPIYVCGAEPGDVLEVMVCDAHFTVGSNCAMLVFLGFFFL